MAFGKTKNDREECWINRIKALTRTRVSRCFKKNKNRTDKKVHHSDTYGDSSQYLKMLEYKSIMQRNKVRIVQAKLEGCSRQKAQGSIRLTYRRKRVVISES